METKGNEGVKFSYYEIVLWHQLGWGGRGGSLKTKSVNHLNTFTPTSGQNRNTQIFQFSKFVL